jgi:chloramphenicol-sensitive protein RarD
MLWSLPWLLLFIAVKKEWSSLRAAVASRRTRLTLVVSTCMIAANSGTFIWAVNHDHILDASLGYFINPLISVLLGLLFLGERLSRQRWIAVVIAAVGVAILTVHLGHPPWISLILALCFGLYGLLRKVVDAGPVIGLTVELALLAPLCALYLGRAELRGVAAFGHHGPGTDALLAGAGLVTVVPLLLFTYGARRLSLATVGFLQYLAPTGQLLLAVLVYHEPFSPSHVAAFSLIWIALGIYSADLRRRLA